MGHDPLMCAGQNHGILDGSPSTPQNVTEKNDWYPFESHLKFKAGKFLFTDSQMLQSHVNSLMQLWMASMLHHKDQSPFTNHSDLHQVTDAIPHGDIPWKSIQVKYSATSYWIMKCYNAWYYDPNTVISNLLGNPDFHEHFDYTPCHEFEPTGQCQWENFMSCNWAWHHLDPAMHDTMIVPIIFGSDKTTVSVVTGQNNYYPLYLSICNIYNNTCSDHKSEDNTEFQKFQHQLFHMTLAHILSSLCNGMHAMYSLAAYIANYPEQILLSCIMQGWCPLMPNNFDGHNDVSCSQEHTKYCIHALALANDLTPFTNDFPYADIYKMLSPNLLHHIIKGDFKDHLVTWISKYFKIRYGEAEANHILDDMIAAIPLYPNLQHFPEDDSKALMKVYLPAIESHVPSRIVHTLSKANTFLDFCYHMQRISLMKEFGALNGLCSSITESKHIKAIKKSWWCSNYFKALGQMLITNQGLDKLTAAKVDFENCDMVNSCILSAAMQECKLQDHEDNTGTRDPNIHSYSYVLKSDSVAVLAAHNFPRDIHLLAHYIQQPRLPLLTHHFLHFQLQDDMDPNINNEMLPNLSNSFVSVFFSAIPMFYAPSNLSGLGGMHSEHIWSTPCWKKGSACYDMIYTPGMGGLHVAHVFLFFSLIHDSVKYLCMLIQWFTTMSDGPDENTGMWITQLEFNADSQQELEVIHIDCTLHGAHLIPVYRHHTDTLDIFKAYYVICKYIDHHAFKIAF
ncbi:hypothetical protein J3A83DRAFT_4359153 [Scleroderma citrinum]